jgi:phosphoribosylanthranilate isomerase
MGVKLKVCGMRDPDNIQQLAALQPDYMGFIFYAPSKRFVGDLDPALIKLLPSGIKPTGVFVDESLDKVIELSNKYQLRAIQLHGAESSDYCFKLKQQNTNIEVIKAFGINQEFNFELLGAYQHVVDYFLFDTQTAAHGGSGRTFDWAVLENYRLQVPYFLSGGIALEHVALIQAISDARLYAVDVNSRFESDPAIKNIEQIMTFKNQL